jgi:hypothetical protein
MISTVTEILLGLGFLYLVILVRLGIVKWMRSKADMEKIFEGDKPVTPMQRKLSAFAIFAFGVLFAMPQPNRWESWIPSIVCAALGVVVVKRGQQ